MISEIHAPLFLPKATLTQYIYCSPNPKMGSQGLQALGKHATINYREHIHDA